MRQGDIRITHVNVIGRAVVIRIQAAGYRNAAPSRRNRQSGLRDDARRSRSLEIALGRQGPGNSSAVWKTCLPGSSCHRPKIEMAQVPAQLVASEILDRSAAAELATYRSRAQPL